MNVDQIIVDCSGGNQAVIDYDVGNFDHTKLWCGVKQHPNCLDGVVLTISGRGKIPDYVDNPLSWPICSEPLTRFLERHAPESCQFLNCRCIDDEGHSIAGFSVLNVLKVIDVLDRAHSDFTEDEGMIDMVYDWTFRSVPILDEKMVFRDKSFPYAVFFTRALALEVPRLNGFLFSGCRIY